MFEMLTIYGYGFLQSLFILLLNGVVVVANRNALRSVDTIAPFRTAYTPLIKVLLLVVGAVTLLTMPLTYFLVAVAQYVLWRVMWLTRMRAWRVCCDLCDMEAELDMQDEEDMYNREDETEDAIKDDEEEDAESNDPFNKNRAIVEETMTYKEFKVVNTQYKRLYIAFLAVFCVAFLLPFGLQCYFNIQESRAAATTMTAYLGAGIEPQTHEIVLGKPIFSMVEREHVYYRELRNGQYIMREAFPCLIAKTDTHYAKGKLHQLLERYTEKARYCQYTPIKITILDEYGNVLLEESGEWNIEKCTVERQQNTGTYMVMMHDINGNRMDIACQYGASISIECGDKTCA